MKFSGKGEVHTALSVGWESCHACLAGERERKGSMRFGEVVIWDKGLEEQMSCALMNPSQDRGTRQCYLQAAGSEGSSQ